MISGVQKSEGEDIEWSDKLPEHSRLSQSVKLFSFYKLCNAFSVI